MRQKDGQNVIIIARVGGNARDTCINNGIRSRVYSEINFILPRRGKFSRDIPAQIPVSIVGRLGVNRKSMAAYVQSAYIIIKFSTYKARRVAICQLRDKAVETRKMQLLLTIMYRCISVRAR
jgi:hypothetical protein